LEQKPNKEQAISAQIN